MPLTAIPIEDNDPRIRAAQTESLYRHAPMALVASMLVVAFVAVVMWNIFTDQRALWWSVSVGLVTLLRGGCVGIFLRRGSEWSTAFWQRLFLVGTVAAGAACGFAGIVLYVPGAVEYQAILAVALLGLGAGSIASLTTYLPAFYAYFTLLAVPIIVRLYLDGGATHTIMASIAASFYIMFVLFARDINRTLVESLKLRYENVELVESLTREKDAAERASIGKSKFLAAASHDLRQPLHALSLFANALGERIRYPEVRRIVDNIQASVQSLESLFNALLDISKLDSGVLQPKIEDFHLKTIFDRLENDYRPQAGQKGLELEMRRCDEVVRTDKTLLERILRNLVTNAIRYTEEGQITVSCQPAHSGVRIEVGDTGIGIPPEYLGEIFDEYVQLNNPERDRGKGLGLGLAIVDRIARLLGHRLRVHSVPGEGSVFSIEVPAGDAAAVEPMRMEGFAVAGHELRGLSVLVIDDEASVREAMQVLLGGWGCDVIAASSEDGAIAALERREAVPDVVLADYRLREGRTGVEAIRAIEARVGGPVPAMLITGDIGIDRLRDVDTSGYGVLHKPVKPARLRAFLKHAMKQKKNAIVQEG